MLLVKFAEDVYFPDVKSKVRGNTYQGYESAYVKYIRPYFLKVHLEDVTLSKVQKFVNSIEKPGAARRSFCTLRQILNCARRHGASCAGSDTVRGTHLPATEGNCNAVLSVSEAADLIRAFRGHPLEACVTLCVMLGLRRCEAFGVMWKDINFSTGQVYVRRSRQYVKGREVVYPPKTRKSKRTCVLPKKHLRRLKKIKIKTKARDSDYVMPLSVKDAASEYKSHVLHTGVTYTPFMNLRHTYASASVECGTDVCVVARMLGHTSTDMAYSRYVLVSNRVQRRCQRKLSRSIALAGFVNAVSSTFSRLICATGKV